MSLTVSVASCFSGSPLRPPLSFECRLFSVSGRVTVVLDTIRPSTPPYNTQLQTQCTHTSISYSLKVGTPHTYDCCVFISVSSNTAFFILTPGVATTAAISILSCSVKSGAIFTSRGGFFSCLSLASIT